MHACINTYIHTYIHAICVKICFDIMLKYDFVNTTTTVLQALGIYMCEENYTTRIGSPNIDDFLKVEYY